MSMKLAIANDPTTMGQKEGENYKITGEPPPRKLGSHLKLHCLSILRLHCLSISTLSIPSSIPPHSRTTSSESSSSSCSSCLLARHPTGAGPWNGILMIVTRSKVSPAKSFIDSGLSVWKRDGGGRSDDSRYARWFGKNERVDCSIGSLARTMAGGTTARGCYEDYQLLLLFCVA